MTICGDVLFGYQREAAERIVAQRSILLADQPGLGKTLEVLGACELDGLFERPSIVLIITPIINAQSTWRDAVERFVQSRYDVNLVDVSKGSAVQKAKAFAGLDVGRSNIVLANHNAIDMTPKGLRVAGLVDHLYDAVVVDESHMVLPMRDPRYKTNFWKGLLKLRQHKGALSVAVSGTPDRGKLENRYGTWLFLSPRHTPANRWVWLEENFWVVEQQVARNRVVKTVQGLKHPERWADFDKQMMIRRTKAEVLPQLPPKQYVDVVVELGKEQRSAYRVQELVSGRKIFDAKLEERDSGEAMVFALRARQLATCSWSEAEGSLVPVVGGHSAKFEWLLEWFAERGFFEQDSFANNEAKVVIVSQFAKVLHWLEKELALVGVRAEVLDGSVSDSKRASIQKEFQLGDLRVVLLSGSMGVGITLDAADDLILLDSPYDPDRVEQIEDRVHRASNMHSVTIWNVMAEDTIDEAVVERVSKRYKVTRQMLDGSRGVEFGRRVVGLIRKEAGNE